MPNTILPGAPAKPGVTAPSLDNGPLAEAGRAAVAAAARLGRNRRASILRAWAVHDVFAWCEEIYKSAEPPLPQFAARLNQLADWFDAAARLAPTTGEAHAPSTAPVEEITGRHYGELFKAFDPEAYFEETASILRQRLENNGIDVAQFRDKRVLDAGCGGGRYSVAWRRLGAAPVVGVDMSEIGVMDARRRVTDAGIDGVTFEIGSVLDLPFPSDSFDVAFSNGVLHHTVNWQVGVHELLRVLRPGGFGWLYLIEDPGGLHWDSIEILRTILDGESKDLARDALRLLGVASNRAFYMLDHVMAPINVRLPAWAVESALAEAGATDVRRLTRGCHFDRIERVHEDVPFAADKFGVAEHRYVFTKPQTPS